MNSLLLAPFLVRRFPIPRQQQQSSRASQKPLPTTKPRLRLMSPVGIIGAGVAGLKAAMLLSQAGIPFEIIEASNRVGGRLFTYQFSDQPYDYFDVGAMRYPDIPPMQSTFDLFKELGWVPGGPGRLIPYYLSSSNTVQEFNDIRMQGPPPVDIDANVLPRLYIFLSHTNRHCVQLRAEAQHSRVIKVDCRP
jgi:Flavin containing amine oxidoreductase